MAAVESAIPSSAHVHYGSRVFSEQPIFQAFLTIFIFYRPQSSATIRLQC